MRVGYLMPPTLAGRQNGVVSQALTWKAGLEAAGIQVDLITPWDTYAWSQFDAIHAFTIGYFLDLLPHLKRRGARRIVLSPIFDSNRAEWSLRLLSHLNLRAATCKTAMAQLRDSLPAVDHVLVRSDFEAGKLRRIVGVPDHKLVMCRLPVRFLPTDDGVTPKREPVCLHVSILSAPTKNVRRLVEASIRYRFPLRLGGQINDPSFDEWLSQVMRQHDHIQYLGVLSDEALRHQYRTARVFALPSLMEGVGLVALEAALDGADVVITDRGAPREYFGSLVRVVDPEQVDDIGRAVSELLAGETHQPELSRRVARDYSLDASVRVLAATYAGQPLSSVAGDRRDMS